MKRTKKEMMENVKDAIDSKVIGNNTIEYHKEDGTRVIRLHLTDIITFNTDNTIVLNSGGYKTATTKERMNRFIPASIVQANSIWYVKYYSKTYIFKDGITLYPDGTVTGYGAEENNKKEINKFIDGYMDKLINRELEKPGSGDCFYCQANFNHSDHIKSHIEESYYVPSIMFNAIKEFPISPIAQNQIGYYFKYHNNKSGYAINSVNSQIKSSLKRFLYRQLGYAS
jgi:hypothetical protein